jgi:DNA ligase-1
MDLADGETTQVKGSGSATYTLKNSGGVYSCTCPAWMHQSVAIEKRTCKHLRAYRGDQAEKDRTGGAELPGKPARPARGPSSGSGSDGEEEEAEGPPLLLAEKWEPNIDITGWWLSEKLDGVRAYWDGTQLLSRLGNRFHPPPWFIESLPKATPLDGELWGGRKLFQRTVGIVKRQDQSPLWKDLLYVVFDAPKHDGSFEERIAHCETVLRNQKYARVHAQSACTGIEHLRAELARIEALGGEGLMARRPKSRYEAGRSSSLLKVKSFKDAEARVVGHVAGAGRHKGRLGALHVELSDGTRFNVGMGFSDREREDPPAIGSLITFRYQELSDGGVPRFPTYVGERVDASGPSSLSSEKLQRKAFSAGAASASGQLEGAPPPPADKKTEQQGKRRRFERVEDDAHYFWEIEQEGAVHRIRQGTYATKSKTFASAADATKALGARIAEQIAKGFEEVDD